MFGWAAQIGVEDLEPTGTIVSWVFVSGLDWQWHGEMVYKPLDLRSSELRWLYAHRLNVGRRVEDPCMLE